MTQLEQEIMQRIEQIQLERDRLLFAYDVVLAELKRLIQPKEEVIDGTNQQS